MKTLLAIIALLPLAAFAAAPVVTISDTGNCIVDGVNVGAPADAIDNNPALAPAIQKAFVAYVAKTASDAAASIKTAQDAAAKSTADAQAAAKKASDDAIAANAAELAKAKSDLADAQAKIADLEKQLAALGVQRGELNTPAAETP